MYPLSTQNTEGGILKDFPKISKLIINPLNFFNYGF